MLNYLYVFIGGGLGSLCRYGIAVGLRSYTEQFPYATLIANILSCIVLGCVIAWSQKTEAVSWTVLLIATGFCGGFSTFSTFSLETFTLMSNGDLGTALLNVLMSVLVCLGAIYLGLRLGGWLVI